MKHQHIGPRALGLLALGLLVLGTRSGLAQTETPEADAEPLGLELWLSGEEPGSPEPSPNPIDPTVNLGQPLEEPPDLAGEPGADATSSLDPDDKTPLAAPSPSNANNPVIVLTERSGECQGQFSPGEGLELGNDCQTMTLEQLAQGQALRNSNEEITPESPLQATLQAFGQVMQTSSDIKDYYFQTQRPQNAARRGDQALVFPLKTWAPITSVFGWRVHPLTQDQRFHSGTDLGAFWGTPVVAGFSGDVVVADWLGGYGVTVILNHPDRDQQTLYGHLSEVFVKPGDRVTQGDVIGRVGSTGKSTGPHLHFEIQEWQSGGWVAVNGEALLTEALAHLGQGSVTLAEAPPQNPIQGAQRQGVSNPLERWISWLLQALGGGGLPV